MFGGSKTLNLKPMKLCVPGWRRPQRRAAGKALLEKTSTGRRGDDAALCSMAGFERSCREGYDPHDGSEPKNACSRTSTSSLSGGYHRTSALLASVQHQETRASPIWTAACSSLSVFEIRWRGPPSHEPGSRITRTNGTALVDSISNGFQPGPESFRRGIPAECRVSRPKVLDVKRSRFEDGIDRFIKKEPPGNSAQSGPTISILAISAGPSQVEYGNGAQNSAKSLQGFDSLFPTCLLAKWLQPDPASVQD